MKVLLVSGGFPPLLDGIGDYTNKLYEQMCRDIGRENVYVVTKANADRKTIDPHVISSIQEWNMVGVSQTIRLIKCLRPDIVHIQYPPTSFGRSISTTLLPLMLRLLTPSVRVFCTVHEFENKKLQGKLRLVASMIPSHRIVIVNESYRKAITSYCPFLAPRLVFVPIGSNVANFKADPERRQALRKKMGWAPDDIVAAYFGILREGKGLDLLLDAFLTARQAVPELRLLLIGGTGAQWDGMAFERKIRANGALGAVFLTGRVTEREASDYLATADFSALPFTDGVSTKRTGFTAAVEHALPVVTTYPCGNMPELKEGDNVLLVPRGDMRALSQAITRLATDCDLRTRLGNGTALLQERFSWDRIVREHLTLYEA
jgi:glycosyltransferase involved in cell wall biosynthesis